MNGMDTRVTTPAVDPDLQAVLDHLSSGKPLDPEVAKRVRAKGQKIREDIFKKHGVLDIGVPAIRELRGDLPE